MTTIYKNTYANPWHNPFDKQYGPSIYWNNAPLVLEYREVKVYKLFDQAFDYVFKGVCITQRIKASKGVIDRILDGKCHYVRGLVADHLKENGISVLEN